MLRTIWPGRRRPVRFAEVVLSQDDGETAFVQDGAEPLDYKEQIPLHQTNRNRFGDGTEDTQACDLGDGFLAPALLLFCFDRRISYSDFLEHGGGLPQRCL